MHRARRANRRTVTLAGVAVVGLLTALFVGPHPSVNAETRSLKVAIPAYIFSDDMRGWETIISRASEISVAVMNPRSGPNVFAGTRCDGFTPPDDPGTGPDLTGLRYDETFVSILFPHDPELVTTSLNYLSTLQTQFARRATAMNAAGMPVYGYVWSNTNGADQSCPRALPIIESEIEMYRTRYGVTNVFFDDAASVCPHTLRQSMSNAARAVGAKVVMNVGTSAQACLADEADVVGNFEGTPTSYLSARAALELNAAQLRQRNPSVKIWHIVHSTADADLPAIIAQARETADLLHIGDDRPTSRGCDLGGSTFDSLYGMWPRIRADTPACAGRFNTSTHSWTSVVDAITATVRNAAPPTVTQVNVRTAAPSAASTPNSGRRAAPQTR